MNQHGDWTAGNSHKKSCLYDECFDKHMSEVGSQQFAVQSTNV